MEKTYRALPDRKKKKFVDIWTKKKAERKFSSQSAISKHKNP